MKSAVTLGAVSLSWYGTNLQGCLAQHLSSGFCFPKFHEEIIQWGFFSLRMSEEIREGFGEDCGLRILSSTKAMNGRFMKENHFPPDTGPPKLAKVPVPQMQCESYRAARLKGPHGRKE